MERGEDADICECTQIRNKLFVIAYFNCGTVATSNSKTNKTMILESLFSSYIVFLKRNFTQSYQTEGLTKIMRKVHLPKSQTFKKMKAFVDKQVKEITEVFKFEEIEEEIEAAEKEEEFEVIVESGNESDCIQDFENCIGN